MYARHGVCNKNKNKNKNELARGDIARTSRDEKILLFFIFIF